MSVIHCKSDSVYCIVLVPWYVLQYLCICVVNVQPSMHSLTRPVPWIYRPQNITAAPLPRGIFVAGGGGGGGYVCVYL